MLIGFLASLATAILVAIVYAITDIYLSGHNIEYDNPLIDMGFTQTTMIDLIFLLTSAGGGVLAAWLYLRTDSKNRAHSTSGESS